MVTGLPLATTSRMRALSAQRSARAATLSLPCAWVFTSAVTGRPSRVHFSQPPFSTATLSKPIERNIHQTRVDHIGKPLL